MLNLIHFNQLQKVPRKALNIGGFHAISGDTNNNGEMNKSELMSDLLFTVHQHGGDDVT